MRGADVRTGKVQSSAFRLAFFGKLKLELKTDYCVEAGRWLGLSISSTSVQRFPLRFQI
jgi:hypothetical protein